MELPIHGVFKIWNNIHYFFNFTFTKKNIKTGRLVLLDIPLLRTIPTIYLSELGEI